MVLIDNKKAKLRFAEVESFSAGIELLGTEAKSLRNKLGSLEGARVFVRGGEAYIVNMTIPPHQVKNAPEGYDPERVRKLLLTKDQIAQIADAESKKGLTIVPFEVYNDRYIKVRVAIVRGKGKVDKREDLKLKDAKRDMDRAMKQKATK